MRVAVLGLGYVGTVTAACLASRGHTVRGVDVDAAKGGTSAPAAAR
jgi:GDP-mannose 6-dehydrogenase